MDFKNCASSNFLSSLHLKTSNVPDKLPENPRYEGQERATGRAVVADVDIDLREVFFLIMQFLSIGPCQKTFAQLFNELMEHQLLPRRYHAWYSRTGLHSGDDNDDGVSLPLAYETLVHRFPHISKDHLVRLLKQLMVGSPQKSPGMGNGSSAADVPTLLGSGSFSLLSSHLTEKKQVKVLPRYLHWPHMQIDQVHGLHLRAIGGGFTRHHRASSIQAACYAIAKPSTMVQKMQNITRLRGHRFAVYCAIFDRSGRYVITGADDRLVKVWSMETAFCLASCRGHEGDITDLAVSSNNALVASASNDFVIRVWRLPDGYPISILQGHTGAVTAIAFTPRTGSAYQLLSSSDDGTCRIWDARNSQCKPRLYVPKPVEAGIGTVQQNHQILCCAYNANGSVFVSGSSDTFARVWYAFKSSADDPEQPCHEIDLLAGHENDVNYVQFSGCATTPRSTTIDAAKEDHSTRFKNSWFTHDNIVTCSRDGSAIIWTPRSRRSHGKIGRWTKAYHLKVPPPPLPPQPPRGGPRRRILPTPRGVNMIVWSLDNRFVLAAIMDCRICVWNAADGSLVHCLNGHTESTYVLDVHPFNPRIAMSAGYDGKTIIWDIWEGTPVRTFEIGRGKLVDGKFSSDGTSIVLSDSAGQIYLLNTGQGESQKDAKYDQFFLGDYRPLVRDTLGNVVDQESQLLPYQRNMQDPLCDSSMIPYPEPYQSIFQRRRLGVLGLEWRPSSLRFAVGPDFSLGDDYQMPLPDPEAIIDVPEPLDPTLWEPDNEVIPDDTDSEYDVGEECPSAKEQESLSSSSSEDFDAGSFEHKQRQRDGLRRSMRKNEKAEATIASSERRIRRKRVEDCAGSASQSKRIKRVGRKEWKKKSLNTELSRPQRAAARNAMNVFSKIPETSSLGEFGDDSEIDSSDNESVSQDSGTQGYEPDWGNHEELLEPQASVGNTNNPMELSEPQPSVENKKNLVLKISIRDSRKSLHNHSEGDNINKSEPSSSLLRSEEDRPTSLSDGHLALHTLEATNQKPSQSVNKVLIKCKGLLDKSSSHMRSLRLVDDVEFPSELSAGADIPVEGSSSAHVQKSCEGDAGFRLKESADAVIDDNSHEFKKRKPSVATRIRIKTSGLPKQEKTSKLKSVIGEKELAWDSVTKTRDPSYGSGEENVSSTSYYDDSPGSDFPDVETDPVRLTRSIEMNASTRDAEKGKLRLKLRKGDSSVWTSSPSRDWMPKSNTCTRSMSTRGRQGDFYEDNRGFPSISLSTGKRISWLMLCEHEPGYHYIPQLGDQIAYLRQGHEEYLQEKKERDPLLSIREKLKDVEICVVEELDYATAPGSGESCCNLTLKFIDRLSWVFGKSFRLNLPELLSNPDYLVEKTWYDTAVSKNWTPGDVCSVWWKNENGEGGSWWEGWIVSANPKSAEFPDSPWERYAVQYKGDPDTHFHSPWELHDLECQFEPLHINFDTRNKVLDCLSKLERRKDDGFLKLEQVCQRTDFLNRFPVPLSPDVIRSRLKHNYYRSVDAVKHDIDVMISNAISYFSKNADFSKKMKRLSEHFDRRLTALCCEI